MKRKVHHIWLMFFLCSVVSARLLSSNQNASADISDCTVSNVKYLTRESAFECAEHLSSRIKSHTDRAFSQNFLAFAASKLHLNDESGDLIAASLESAKEIKNQFTRSAAFDLNGALLARTDLQAAEILASDYFLSSKLKCYIFEEAAFRFGLDAALNIMGRISSDSMSGMLGVSFQSVGRALARSHRLQELKELIDAVGKLPEIDNLSDYPSLLSEYGAALFLNDEKEIGIETLARAERLAHQIRRGYERGEAYANIALSYFRIGEKVKALSALERIPAETIIPSATKRFIYYHKITDSTDAIFTLELVKDPYERIIIATKYFESLSLSERMRSKALFSGPISDWAEENLTSTRDYGLFYQVQFHLLSHDFEEALAILEKIEADALINSARAIIYSSKFHYDLALDDDLFSLELPSLSSKVIFLALISLSMDGVDPVSIILQEAAGENCLMFRNFQIHGSE